jgi:hypothetical protein
VSDVSTGGLRFTSRRRVPLGARLCLQVRPSAGAGLIEIKGRVAWRRDMAALGRCDLAVTFDPDDASGPVPDVRERMLRQAAGGRAPAS